MPAPLSWMMRHLDQHYPELLKHPRPEARPASEYHNDMGPVLWWRFPIVEPPYVGGPTDLGQTVEIVVRYVEGEGRVAEELHRHLIGGWPGYHTHFTPIVCPSLPSA